MQSHSAQARTRRIVITATTGERRTRKQGARSKGARNRACLGAWLHGCMPPEFPLIPSNLVTEGELSTGSITYHRAGF